MCRLEGQTQNPHISYNPKKPNLSWAWHSSAPAFLFYSFKFITKSSFWFCYNFFFLFKIWFLVWKSGFEFQVTLLFVEIILTKNKGSSVCVGTLKVCDYIHFKESTKEALYFSTFWRNWESPRLGSGEWLFTTVTRVKREKPKYWLIWSCLWTLLTRNFWLLWQLCH